MVAAIWTSLFRTSWQHCLELEHMVIQPYKSADKWTTCNVWIVWQAEQSREPKMAKHCVHMLYAFSERCRPFLSTFPCCIYIKPDAGFAPGIHKSSQRMILKTCVFSRLPAPKFQHPFRREEMYIYLYIYIYIQNWFKQIPSQHRGCYLLSYSIILSVSVVLNKSGFLTCHK